MRFKKQRPEPATTTTTDPVTAATAQFQAEVPGVGICDRCGQPGTRRHRCQPAKEAKR